MWFGNSPLKGVGNWVISFIVSTVGTGKRLGLDKPVSCSCYIILEKTAQDFVMCVDDKVVFDRRRILMEEIRCFEKGQKQIM